MTPDDAAALSVPLRVVTFVRRALGDAAASSGGESDGVGGDGGWSELEEAAIALADAEVVVGAEEEEEGPPSTATGISSSSSSSFNTQQQEDDDDNQQQPSSSIDTLEEAAAAGLTPAEAVLRRVAPPRRRPFKREHVNVTRRTALPPYGLRDEEVTPRLRAELDEFASFSTGRFYGQRVEPISDATLRVDLQHFKSMLGWLHRHRGVPLEDLSLRSMFPTSEERSVALAFDFVEFLANERGANARTQFNALMSCVHAVRFLYHDESKPSLPSPGAPRVAPYGDLPLMRALKALSAKAHRAAKRAPLVADERLKWLEWDEFLALTADLRADCAGERSGRVDLICGRE